MIIKLKVNTNSNNGQLNTSLPKKEITKIFDKLNLPVPKKFDLPITIDKDSLSSKRYGLKPNG